MSTTSEAQKAPSCPAGHGPMKRGSFQAGLWPGYFWICSQYRTCPRTERTLGEPAEPLPR